MYTGTFGGKPRRRCTQCRFIHFEEPKLAVAAMAINDTGLLLVQRAVVPQKGKWSLPAGYLDVGESPQEGVVREVLEETGLHVSVGRLVEAFYNPPGQGAAVVLVYKVEVIGGELRAADDASAAEFFPPNALPPLAFESTRNVVSRARRALARAAAVQAAAV
jgi:8-oxo-dGTP diphosphatase